MPKIKNDVVEFDKDSVVNTGQDITINYVYGIEEVPEDFGRDDINLLAKALNKVIRKLNKL